MPLARTRAKLAAFVALAAAGAGAGISWWAVGVLLLTTAAIVVAAGLLGGPRLVRALLCLPSRPQPVRHRTERTKPDARLRSSGRTPAQPR
ncbi:hypothetical protein BDK92_2577 [Micromonospora pisi]|uniref:Uncharacterized protein n=2 Tax=Micromonospora pisi TaxID=589240 RepID=A0A495JJV0_9ACTN|nr:hypothetical protein BDK92_2577 [Micromonospora pisi]